MMGQTKEHEVGIDPVCPHRAIVNLLHPVSTQCDLDPVCVPIELPASYLAMPGLSCQEYIVQAYCVLYYVQSIYIVQIGFFLSTQCSLVDNVLRLSSWHQDGEASAGADPGASNVELSVQEAGLQQSRPATFRVCPWDLLMVMA